MINPNEQRVIAAASGTFEYDGKIYKSKDSYLNQMAAKLDEEKVELTSEEADSAIAQMMSNVAEGVKRGYLEEVKGSGDSDKTTQEETKDSKNTGQKDAGTDVQQNSITDHDERQSGGEQESEFSDSSDSEAATIVPLQINEIHPEAVESFEEVQVLSENSQIAAELNTVSIKQSLIAVLVWALFVGATAFYLKKFKHRRKMAGAMIGSILIGFSVLMIGYGYLFQEEMVSKNRWEKVVTESGYLKDNYNQVLSGLKQTVTRAGLPEEVLSEVFADSVVYRDAKMMISTQADIQDKMLEKKKENILADWAKRLPNVPTDQQTQLADHVIARYKSGLTIAFSDYIREHQEAGMKNFWICLAFGIAGIAVAVVVLIKKTRFKHRAVRAASFGFLGGGLSLSVMGALSWVSTFQMQIEPASYQNLFGAYMKSILLSGLYYGVLALCVGLGLQVIAYIMKTRIE